MLFKAVDVDNGQSEPHKVFKSPSEEDVSIFPNPGAYPNLCAVHCADFSLHLLDMETGEFRTSKSLEDVYAVCWSVKGKRLAFGDSSGCVQQIDPEMSLKVKILPPSELAEPQVKSILWLEDNKFLVVYSLLADIEETYLITRFGTKASKIQTTYEKVLNPCHPFTARMSLYFTARIFAMGKFSSLIPFANYSNSSIAFVSCVDGKFNNQRMNDDVLLLDIPILDSSSSVEVYPMGMDVDFTCTQSLEDVGVPAVPKLYILTNLGNLVIFNIVDETLKGAEKSCNSMVDFVEPLKVSKSSSPKKEVVGLSATASEGETLADIHYLAGKTTSEATEAPSSNSAKTVEFDSKIESRHEIKRTVLDSGSPTSVRSQHSDSGSSYVNFSFDQGHIVETRERSSSPRDAVVRSKSPVAPASNVGISSEGHKYSNKSGENTATKPLISTERPKTPTDVGHEKQQKFTGSHDPTTRSKSPLKGKIDFKAISHSPDSQKVQFNESSSKQKLNQISVEQSFEMGKSKEKLRKSEESAQDVVDGGSESPKRSHSPEKFSLSTIRDLGSSLREDAPTINLAEISSMPTISNDDVPLQEIPAPKPKSKISKPASFEINESIGELSAEFLEVRQLPVNGCFSVSSPLNLPESEPIEYDLLAISNKFGFVVFGIQDGFAFAFTEDIRRAAAKASPKEILRLQNVVEVKMEDDVVNQIRLSSDNESVIVGLTSGNVFIFKSIDLAEALTGSSVPAEKLKCPSDCDFVIVPNPEAFPNVCALKFSDGSLFILDSNSDLELFRQICEDISVKSICWSRKWKLLAVGDNFGVLRTVGLDGAVKSTIQMPESVGSGSPGLFFAFREISVAHMNSAVTQIVWLEDKTFLIIYADEGSFVVSQTGTKKTGLHTVFQKVDELSPADFGAKNCIHYLYSVINSMGESDFLIPFGSNASESISFLGCRSRQWRRWIPNNEEIYLPISSENDENTYCMGLAVDFNSKEKVKSSRADKSDLCPAPLLYILNDAGSMLIYSLVDETSESRSKACELMCEAVDILRFSKENSDNEGQGSKEQQTTSTVEKEAPLTLGKAPESVFGSKFAGTTSISFTNPFGNAGASPSPIFGDAGGEKRQISFENPPVKPPASVQKPFSFLQSVNNTTADKPLALFRSEISPKIPDTPQNIPIFTNPPSIAVPSFVIPAATTSLLQSRSSDILAGNDQVSIEPKVDSVRHVESTASRTVPKILTDPVDRPSLKDTPETSPQIAIRTPVKRELPKKEYDDPSNLTDLFDRICLELEDDLAEKLKESLSECGSFVAAALKNATITLQGTHIQISALKEQMVSSEVAIMKVEEMKNELSASVNLVQGKNEHSKTLLKFLCGSNKDNQYDFDGLGPEFVSLRTQLRTKILHFESCLSDVRASLLEIKDILDIKSGRKPISIPNVNTISKNVRRISSHTSTLSKQLDDLLAQLTIAAKPQPQKALSSPSTNKFSFDYEEDIPSDKAPPKSLPESLQRRLQFFSALRSASLTAKTHDVCITREALSTTTSADSVSGSWTCSICLTPNDESKATCVACEASKKKEGKVDNYENEPLKHVAGFPSSSEKTERWTSCETSRVVDDKSPRSGHAGFSPRSLSKTETDWICDSCLVKNKHSSDNCQACESPREKHIASSAAESGKGFSFSPAKIVKNSPVQTTKFTFGNMISDSESDWTCQTCLVRNKSSASQCAACETQRVVEVKDTKSTDDGKGLTVTSSKVVPPTDPFRNSQPRDDSKPTGFKFFPASVTTPSATTFAFVQNQADQSQSNTSVGFKFVAPESQNIFQSAGKTPNSNWTCPTCLIQNDITAEACAACETKKEIIPEAKSENSSKPSFLSSSTSDAVSSGTEKAAKWTCEVCLVSNPSDAVKCIACENARNGFLNSPKGSSELAQSVPLKVKSTVSEKSNVPEPLPSVAESFGGFGTPVIAESSNSQSDSSVKLSQTQGFGFGTKQDTGSIFALKTETSTSEAVSSGFPSMGESLGLGSKTGANSINPMFRSALSGSAPVTTNSTNPGLSFTTKTETSVFGSGNSTNTFGGLSNALPTFGSQTPAMNTGFGQVQKPAFGQPQASAFGQASQVSVFGQSSQATGGGSFGQPVSNANIATPKSLQFSQPSASTFTQSSLTAFGTAQSAFQQSPASGSVFGQSGFGTPSPGFSQTATQQSVFGGGGLASATGSAFGQSGFGQKPAGTAFGAFGASATTAFPSVSANTSVFGQSASAGVSSFGSFAA
ncbi:E3 SUMO-protein ligase RanBP2 [Entophlyctis luteolus]|nr:E3 SUMO-protein ligase RanBP2 [Entophlyctis luteolus]